MKPLIKSVIWRQFGATIDMLDIAIHACPEDLWLERLWGEQCERPELSEFWYLAYHALFWLDLYLGGSIEGFIPPQPFTLDELDPAGVMPERTYTRSELQAYLVHCRRKCRNAIDALMDESARKICEFSWGEVPYLELLLDTMRHVQEHAAQLNMFLGQRAGIITDWLEKPKG